MIQLPPSENFNKNRFFLLFLCSFLIFQFFAFVISANSLEICNGIPVEDLSDIEQTLAFGRSKITDNHNGYLGFFKVVGSDGRVLKNYSDVEVLRKRALEYSANKCAPKKIVFPDVVLVIELHENGKITSSTEYENGGKVIKAEKFYKPAGILLAEFPYYDGKINGVAKFYHENGKLNYELNYKDNMREGCFKSYYESGQTKGVGCFANGMLTGPYKHYYKNGIVEIVTKYDPNGNLNGDYLEKYENGNHKVKGFYKEGKLDGLYNEWFENRNVRVNATYANGQIIGESYVYFEDGSVSEHFINGSTKKLGEFNRFFEDGSPLSKVPVINGEYDGIYQEFDKEGKAVATVPYKTGKISGPFKRYYKNGVIQSVSEYKNGSENLRTSYFEHGGVRQRVYYDTNENIERVDVFDIYGALDTRFPYKDGKLDGVVNKFYRDGSAAVAAYIKEGEIINPVIGYDRHGNAVYKIYYDKKGEITNFATLNTSGEVVHSFKKEDNLTKQYEFYPNGSLKFVSVVDKEGNEKREYYNLLDSKRRMFQEFSASGGLKKIFYYLDETAIGCSQVESGNKLVCGKVNKNNSNDIQLMETHIVMDKLMEWISKEKFTKPEILHLINTSSEENILRKNDKEIISNAVIVNSKGQHCYNFGFMEHCQ